MKVAPNNTAPSSSKLVSCVKPTCLSSEKETNKNNNSNICGTPHRDRLFALTFKIPKHQNMLLLRGTGSPLRATFTVTNKHKTASADATREIMSILQRRFALPSAENVFCCKIEGGRRLSLSLSSRQFADSSPTFPEVLRRKILTTIHERGAKS